jgi:hypothetical protein
MKRGYPENQTKIGIYLFAILSSILLSLWFNAREMVINPDGICYLQSAQMIGSTGLHAAMQLCDQAKWPLYSVLIFMVVKATQFSYLTAAYLLDGFFSLISVLAFVYLTHLLGGSRRVLWLALGVILFASEFNSIRENIVRDHGFWACYLLSLVGLLHYFRSSQWRYALLWSCSLIGAMLFRIEGSLFLLYMPFAAWFCVDKTLKQRLNAFLQLNTLTFIVGIVGLVWLWFAAKYGMIDMGRIGEVEFQFAHGLQLITQNFHAATSALSQHVLSPNAAKDANFVLGLLLFVWYGFSVVGNLSLVYAVLVVYAWRHHVLPKDTAARVVLWGYILVNVVITTIFLVENMFLAKRYLIALSLVLMLWVPFALDYLLKQRKRGSYLLTLFMMLVIVVSSNIFNFGYSKSYIREAGQWLSLNIPEEASLYSNDEQVMHYSHHFGNSIFEKARSFTHADAMLMAGKWKQYDYLALRFNKHDMENNAAILKEIPLTPMQVFANKRGDRVNIYKTH